MEDVESYIAILGRTETWPIPVIVKVGPNQRRVLVGIEPHTELRPRPGDTPVDVSDCTVVRVLHLDREEFPLTDITTNGVDTELCGELLENSIEAVSEFILWSKGTTVHSPMSKFTRRFGLSDIKLFILQLHGDIFATWSSPLLMATPVQLAQTTLLVQSFFGNRHMSNGPDTNPLHPILRRALSVTDLINAGFYLEAFVSMFALVDDTVQEVLREGLKNGSRAFSNNEIERKLRSSGSDRLKTFTTTLMVEAGGRNLEVDNQQLLDDLLSANTLRNKIMHGSAKIYRQEAIDKCNTLSNVLGWLGANPFGYKIPALNSIELLTGYFDITGPGLENLEQQTRSGPDHAGTEPRQAYSGA